MMLFATPAYAPVQYFLPVEQFFYYTAPAPISPPASLRQKLFKLQLSREQMRLNGFPMRIFYDVFIERNEYQQNRQLYVDTKDRKRVCVRCHKTFFVKRNYLQARSQEIACFNTVTGKPEHFHVTDQATGEELKKFRSAPKDLYKQDPQMFAIDVEMVVTAKGRF